MRSGIMGLLGVVLMMSLHAQAALLVGDEFNTSSVPNYTGGVYLDGATMGDTNGNATCTGGSIVGFSVSDAWGGHTYQVASASHLKVKGRKYSYGGVERAISADLSGKTEAYGKTRIWTELTGPGDATVAYVFAGFSADAVLNGGPAFGFSWDDANAHWDLAMRYSNSGGVVVATILDDAASMTARDIYWFMDSSADTIKVWIDSSDEFSTPTLTVTDWVDEVSGLAYLKEFPKGRA